MLGILKTSFQLLTTFPSLPKGEGSYSLLTKEMDEKKRGNPNLKEEFKILSEYGINEVEIEYLVSLKVKEKFYSD